MFNWLNPKWGESTSIPDELAMRTSIAHKLRKYNVDDDTTISEFSLADDGKKTNATGQMSEVIKNDAWSQVNPRETGKWKKENR